MFDSLSAHNVLVEFPLILGCLFFAFKWLRMRSKYIDMFESYSRLFVAAELKQEPVSAFVFGRFLTFSVEQPTGCYEARSFYHADSRMMDFITAEERHIDRFKPENKTNV